MRSDAIFIAVDVDDAVARDPEYAAKLTEVCTVDIFGQAGDGTLEIHDGNLDECVLCRLCLYVVASDPTDPVKIVKLYDNDAVLA